MNMHQKSQSPGLHCYGTNCGSVKARPGLMTLNKGRKLGSLGLRTRGLIKEPIFYKKIVENKKSRGSNWNLDFRLKIQIGQCKSRVLNKK